MTSLEPSSAALRSDPRAFACPGLYRIVPARDGGICRVRIPLGILSSRQARALAGVAAREGSGTIELTNRANIQLRGLPPGDGSFVAAELVETGLAPRDRWVDDTRNILVNPSAGMDPGDILDVCPLAIRLLDLLASDSRYAALSPKFSIQVDGGGACSVADHAHDIWLLAATTNDGAPVFKMGLAGPIDYDTTDANARCVLPQDADSVVAAIVAVFIELGIERHGVSRLRDLIAIRGCARIWRDVEERYGKSLPPALARDIRITAAPCKHPPLGILPQSDPAFRVIGALPALGWIDAAQFETVATIADEFGNGELHLTPWRSLLVGNVPAERADAAVAALHTAGLIVSGGPVMGRMVACSGLGCVSALADVRADAQMLAAGLNDTAGSDSIHLSGCAKSCAVSGAADITLVAVAPGLYDLYRAARNGPSRFGALVAPRLDLDRAKELIAEMAE